MSIVYNCVILFSWSLVFYCSHFVMQLCSWLSIFPVLLFNLFIINIVFVHSDMIYLYKISSTCCVNCNSMFATIFASFMSKCNWINKDLSKLAHRVKFPFWLIYSRKAEPLKLIKLNMMFGQFTFYKKPRLRSWKKMWHKNL